MKGRGFGQGNFSNDYNCLPGSYKHVYTWLKDKMSKEVHHVGSLMSAKVFENDTIYELIWMRCQQGNYNIAMNGVCLYLHKAVCSFGKMVSNLYSGVITDDTVTEFEGANMIQRDFMSWSLDKNRASFYKTFATNQGWDREEFDHVLKNVFRPLKALVSDLCCIMKVSNSIKALDIRHLMTDKLIWWEMPLTGENKGLDEYVTSPFHVSSVEKGESDGTTVTYVVYQLDDRDDVQLIA